MEFDVCSVKLICFPLQEGKQPYISHIFLNIKKSIDIVLYLSKLCFLSVRTGSGIPFSLSLSVMF